MGDNDKALKQVVDTLASTNARDGGTIRTQLNILQSFLGAKEKILAFEKSVLDVECTKLLPPQRLHHNAINMQLLARLLTTIPRPGKLLLVTISLLNGFRKSVYSVPTFEHRQVLWSFTPEVVISDKDAVGEDGKVDESGNEKKEEGNDGKESEISWVLVQSYRKAGNEVADIPPEYHQITIGDIEPYMASLDSFLECGTWDSSTAEAYAGIGLRKSDVFKNQVKDGKEIAEVNVLKREDLDGNEISPILFVKSFSLELSDVVKNSEAFVKSLVDGGNKKEAAKVKS